MNLDFEEARADNKPRGWYAGGDGYDAQLDSTVVYTGRHSLRFTWVGGGPANADAQRIGVCTSVFPVTAARGKKIRLTGVVRTVDVHYGYAGLWLRVDGPSGTLALDNMHDRGLTATHDWTKLEIELTVDTSATQIVFGGICTGSGTVWFDRFEIDLDGMPYEIPEPREPTADQLAWLRAHAIPFNGTEAETGFADLMPFKAIVGDAHIVGLGEATHGTHEFFAMKHRLLEFLVKELGFTVFAIEASSPEAQRVNDYVLHGIGNDTAVVRGMGFWTWSTTEVLDMVRWMRAYNASGAGRVEFVGFDMQSPRSAVTVVKDHVHRVDSARDMWVFDQYHACEEVETEFSLRRNRPPDSSTRALFDAARRAADSVREYLERERPHTMTASGEREYAWALHCAELVGQGMKLMTSNSDSAIRDSCMAANVAWIREQHPPGTRIVLWAHNAHIGRTSWAMGNHLTNRFGADYLPVGFAFHEGTYNAVNGRLMENVARPSAPGSFEYVFHRAGIPRCIIDLRKASSADPSSNWLAGEMDYREIGALADDDFHPTTIAGQWDAMIFFDSTTASHLLTK